MRYLIGASVLTALLFGAGCADGVEPLDVPDDVLAPHVSSWVNQLGLDQTDPDLWRQRMGRACTEGVWDDDTARSLSSEFIEQDVEYSVRDAASGPPSVDEGARTLWRMAAGLCRDSFPPGEIEEGPPR